LDIDGTARVLYPSVTSRVPRYAEERRLSGSACRHNEWLLGSAAPAGG
jgi:hypothetical protein